MSDSNDGRQTQSIADALGMDFEEPDDSVLYESGPLWSYNGQNRGLAFVLVWDEIGYPPQSDLDDVATALLDGESHTYTVDFGDDSRQTSLTGIALMAYVDDDAEVTVDE